MEMKMRFRKHQVDEIKRFARQGMSPEQIANPYFPLEDVRKVFDREALWPKVYDARKSTVPTATPTVAAEQAIENIRYQADHDVKYATRAMSEFAAKFTKNPTHAFEWSQSGFDEAARLQVGQTVLVYLEKLSESGDEYSKRSPVQVLVTMASEFYGETVRRAKWPDRSTSAQSNEMSRSLSAKRAEVTEQLISAVAKVAPERLADVVSPRFN
jgi:hypothetical protein